MGFYVNPPDMTKEEWLEEHGRFVGFVMGPHSVPPFRDFLARNEIPVVLVLNVFPSGSFTAAGIAFSEDEYALFTSARDPRPRKLYAVTRTAVVAVCPEVAPHLPPEGEAPCARG